LRSRLDRTAILTQHKQATLASVLNPPPSKRFGKPAASVLPLMARSFSASAEIEGMLRPRMPVIRLGNSDTELSEDGMNEDEDEDEEEEEEVEGEEGEDGKEDADAEREREATITEREDEHFMGHELDTILESAGRTEIAVRDFAMVDAPDIVTERTGQAASAKEETRPSGVQVHSKEVGKRVHIDPAPSSPSKRIKTGEEAQLMVPALSSTSAVTDQISETIVPQTSEFTVTSTASAVPDLPEPGETKAGGSDSDEDDVVSLVLGQDTDDESD
jgi:pre-rRNA-processing protein RIX1